MAHAYYADELYHHGILGQKWGVRRFQNEDGSLTPEGRIRYRDDGNGHYTKRSRSERKILQKQYDALKKAKLKQEAEEIAKDREKGKKISQMTDKELQEYTTRKQAEKNAYQAAIDVRTKYNELNPTQVSKSKQLIESALKDVIGPAVKDAGKKWLEKKMKEALDLEEKKTETTSQKLKREAEDWKNLADIERNKNAYNDALDKAKKREEKQKESKQEENKQETKQKKTEPDFKTDYDDVIDAEFTVKGEEFVNNLLPALYTGKR